MDHGPLQLPISLYVVSERYASWYVTCTSSLTAQVEETTSRRPNSWPTYAVTHPREPPIWRWPRFFVSIAVDMGQSVGYEFGRWFVVLFSSRHFPQAVQLANLSEVTNRSYLTYRSVSSFAILIIIIHNYMIATNLALIKRSVSSPSFNLPLIEEKCLPLSLQYYFKSVSEGYNESHLFFLQKPHKPIHMLVPMNVITGWSLGTTHDLCYINIMCSTIH